MAPPNKYSADIVEQVRQLWLQDTPKLSMAQIAGIMATWPGCEHATVGVVANLRKRNGWPERDRPGGHPPAAARPAPAPRWRRPPPPPPPPPPAPEDLEALPPSAQPLLSPGRSGRCEWPLGNPRLPGFRWCEDPIVRSRPYYCAVHARIAFAPPGSRGGMPAASLEQDQAA